MMGFREIRTSEKIETVSEKKEQNENYKKIKPQNELSIEEMNGFIENLFKQVALENN